MKIDDEELRSLYELSSRERLQRLKVGLLHLQESPNDEAILEELQREAHSLKGDSRSVGVETVETLIQPIEAILKTIRAKQIALTSEISDRIHQGLSAIEEFVTEAVIDQPSKVDILPILDLLVNTHLQLESQQRKDPPLPNINSQATLAVSSSFIDDDELRSLYELSSRDRLKNLKAGLLRLQQHPTDAITLVELRREAHSLKGDSRSVGIEKIEILIQQIEAILKNLQSGRSTLTASVSYRLFQGLEAIENLVHEAVTNQSGNVNVAQVLEQLVRAVEYPEEVLPSEPKAITTNDNAIESSQTTVDPIPLTDTATATSPFITLTLLEDAELRQLYEISSQQNLQRLEAGLLYLEKNPHDQAKLKELQQDAHSLTGDAEGVGADDIEAIAYQIEEILKTVQLGQITLTTEVSDRLYQGLDAISQLVHEAVTGQRSGVDVSQILDLLLETVADSEWLSVEIPQQLTSIFIEDEELREIYNVSSQERLQRFEAGLLHLEKYPDDATTLEQLLREAHSFKGDARSVGVEPVETLIHQIEEILESFKRKQITLNSNVSDLLYQGMDAIGKLVREAVTGQPSGVDTALVLSRLVEVAPPLNVQDFSLTTSATSSPLVAFSRTVTSDLLPSAKADEPDRIDTIRVQTHDLDALMTQAEELTVTKISITQIAAEVEEIANLWKEWRSDRSRGLYSGAASSNTSPHQERLEKIINALRISTQEGSTRLDKITGELREKIRTLRLLPLSTVFQTLPRIVRDVAKQQSKSVELIIEGEDTTADKSILEEIKDSLMHMVRNAIDHGIETVDERERLGKPAVAKIWLRGYQTANKVVIEVEDDGRGLDLEKIKQTAIKRGLYEPEELAAMSSSQIQSLIFAPGFSTRTFITEISGRGIGLDVVQTNIERLKGEIQIESTPGQGCNFRIQLNTTLTTIDAVLLDVQGVIHALPIEFLETTLRISEDQVLTVEDRTTITFNHQEIPVAELGEVLNLSNSRAYVPDDHVQQKSKLQQCVILKVGEERAGFFVNRLIDVQEVVMKPQSKLLKRVRGVAGATILSTGEVCTILNATDLVKLGQKQVSAIAPVKLKETVQRKSIILLVEDSVPVRTQERRLLERAGYEVVVAVDGLDGYNTLQTRQFDAVLSDVEMPNLDGLSLTAKIRQHQEYESLPIILVTTLDSDEDKKRGADAGANAYIIKGKFNQDVLLEVIGNLI
jgi:two-component system, chemotaxis family, sensor kinase CheA